MRYPFVLIAFSTVIAIALPREVGSLVWLLVALSAFLLFWVLRKAVRGQILIMAPLCFSAVSALALVGSSTILIQSGELFRASHAARFATFSAVGKFSLSVRVREAPRFASGEYDSNAIASHVYVYDRLILLSGTERIQLSGRLRCILRTDLFPDGLRRILPGDRVYVRGHLVPLAIPSNPYDFDTAAWLRGLGTRAMLEAPSCGIFAPDGTPVSFAERFSSWILQKRQRLAGWIPVHFQSLEARELIPAMLIGERSGIRAELRASFRESGLSHLLAISGLHVGILGYGLFWILRVVLSRSRLPSATSRLLAMTVTILFLIFYPAFTGNSASVTRACVMGICFVVASGLIRPSDGANTLALAFSVMLIASPGDLYTPGFQLSFTAVLTILIHVRLRISRATRDAAEGSKRGSVSRILEPIRSLFLISLWIYCTTYPIVAWHFGAVAGAGILVNVIAIPLTSSALICAVVTLICGMLPLGISQFPAALTDLLVRGLSLLAATGGGELGGLNTLNTPGIISPLTLAPPVLFAIWHGFRSRPEGFRRISARRRGLWSALLIVFVLGYRSPILHGPDLAILDVGQGDAAVLRLRDGRCLLIDAGPGASAANSIQRHVSATGCVELDAVFLSHDHADHTGGMSRATLIARNTRVYVPGRLDMISSERRWREGVLPDQIRGLVRGDVLDLGPVTRMYVLGPATMAAESPAGSSINRAPDNNTSLILLVRSGSVSMLFLGDAEARQEIELVRDFGSLLRSNMVKVAHHGSLTSSIQALVSRATVPGQTIAVITAGRNNRFGHPDAEVVERWIRSGSSVHETAADGAFLMTGPCATSVVHEYGYFAFLKKKMGRLSKFFTRQASPSMDPCDNQVRIH